MNLTRWFGLALLLPLLAACAAGGGTRTAAPALTDEQALMQRPVERWNHLIAKTPDQAWEYLSPGYRSANDRSTYMATMLNRPVTWLGATYQDRECEDEGASCKVMIKVDFEVNSPLIGVGKLKSHHSLIERWIKVGGIWYHVPEAAAR